MELERIVAGIDNVAYTEVSVCIEDTTTIDEGDWKDCDDNNDSEDIIYIVVLIEDTEKDD